MNLAFWACVFWCGFFLLLLSTMDNDYDRVMCLERYGECFMVLNTEAWKYPCLFFFLMQLFFLLASHLQLDILFLPFFFLSSFAFGRLAHIQKGRTLKVINDKIHLGPSWVFCDQFMNSLIQPFLFVGIKADDAVYDAFPALFGVHCHVFLLPHYQLLVCRRAVNIILDTTTT